MILRKFLLLLLLICWSTLLLDAVIVWEAQDHVVGDWDLVLNGLSDHEMFPLRQQILQHHQDSDSSTQNNPLPVKRKRKRNVRCHLSLFPNGTFTLAPRQHLYDYESEESIDPDSSSTNLSSPFQRLHLHGRWKVEPNPYCITDRFYDELILEGFPRVQKLIPVPNRQHHHHQQQQQQHSAILATPVKSEPASPQLLLQQLIGIRLSCRIWGRYYRQGRQYRHHQQHQPNRRRPSLAHMTHGSLLLWQVQNNNDQPQEQTGNANGKQQQPWWKPQRRIAATFSGQLLSSPTTTNSDGIPLQEDQELFGY
jgi:hypothetical protein